MSVTASPCLKCTTETGRSQTCHSTCKEYLRWKSEMDERNAIKRNCKDKEAIFLRYKRRHK